MNFYVLLSREDTIYYLRIYHLIVALLMFCCGIIEIEFLWRTRKLPKLDEPHEIPDPALIGAIALTLGIMLGYLYFIVFDYAFQSCDKLVDALYPSELFIEAIYDVLMATFSGLSLVYILHRRFYGAISSNLDKVGRLFINITFAVVWMKVVIYKGYLSHQELCQRKELEGYWCPVIKRHYECNPASELHGTQKMWYYINKGLLSSSIISCASEFFPILLVTHWLACGGAEERAEDIERRMKISEYFKLNFQPIFFSEKRRCSWNASRIHERCISSLRGYLVWFFILITPIVMIMSTLKWLFYFYYTIDFDDLVNEHYMTNDYINLAANVCQVFFFGAVSALSIYFCKSSVNSLKFQLYAFSTTIANERLDAHHKAHARGDISILFGCCVVLFIKLILQSVEIEYQRIDNFIILSDAIIQNVNLVMVQATQWLQYFAVRRLLALSDKDCIATKRFLPLAFLAGLLLAWIHFGVTFFETSLIKYQLTDEKFPFSSTTLICMIFTQTLFPADYLFAFTVSGCYLEFLQRYLNMGYFQLGEPRVNVTHGHGHDHDHDHGHGSVDHENNEQVCCTENDSRSEGIARTPRMIVVLMGIVILPIEHLPQLVPDAPAPINQHKHLIQFAPAQPAALRALALFPTNNVILLMTFQHVHVLLGTLELTAPCVRAMTSDPCSPQPCLQNGVCSSSGGTYTCACATGFYGEQCQYSGDPCTGYCQNGGTCSLIFSETTPYCQCPFDYYGATCGTARSVQTSYVGCYDDSSATFTDYYVYSTTITKGNDCRDALITYREANPTSNYAYSTMSGTKGECLFSTTNTLTDPPNAGLLGGLLAALLATCSYSDMNSGSASVFSLNDVCTPGPCGDAAGNGKCIQTSASAYSCLCNPLKTGTTCQNDATLTPCASVDCGVGTCGITDDQIGSYCLCANTNQTVACVGDPCTTKPCLYGGTCTDLGNGRYSCACLNLYTDTNCETFNPCYIDKCENGGTCIPAYDLLDSTFVCQCTPDWKGTYCEEERFYCDETPCQNGGECEDIIGPPNSYNCTCTPQWTGTNCTTDVDECAEDTTLCKTKDPDATCVNTDGSYYCVCGPNMFGKSCLFNKIIYQILNATYGNLGPDELDEMAQELTNDPTLVRDIVPFLIGGYSQEVRESLSWTAKICSYGLHMNSS
ncbi:Protein CBG05891 [Caenorhabditis briggsae]|uniref:Protein CBG05891 n=1 Tax=Caenorhabditis briggsae TaxID=6238 RepID=A8X1E4_CAEBR|nr:Protein CBG05891 [Caenorhabditis briggsae]CAP26454.2 Protein CBG05891 [Caenorhabditis briggsae]